jgi:hypothetical protein
MGLWEEDTSVHCARKTPLEYLVRPWSHPLSKMCQTSGCLATASFKSKLQDLSDATSSRGGKEEQQQQQAEEELSVIPSAKQSTQACGWR